MKLRNPRRWTRLTIKDVDDHSFVLCRFANACLETAAELNWSGFTCQHCRLFHIYREVKDTPDYPEFYDLFGEKLEPHNPITFNDILEGAAYDTYSGDY